LLKQPQYEPMRLDRQVMIIFAATNGYLDDVPIESVRAFETGFQKFMEASHPEIGAKIISARAIDTENESALKQAIQEFKVAGAY
jgi:F-type H+/Na+-transporting ATPase subunit alpha